MSIYRRLVAAEPENERARHMLAAATGGTPPDRASDGFIRDTFDRFAESFDAQLEKLDYRAPGLIAQTIDRFRVPNSAGLDVLDAGCGTGLSGLLLRTYAKRLTGTEEIHSWLERSTRTFDLIASVDTLCYQGDLSQIMGSFAEILRPGGLLVFSLEQVDSVAKDLGYTLLAHGRYSHTEAYTRRVLLDAGLIVGSMESDVLRYELENSVQGLIVLAYTPRT